MKHIAETACRISLLLLFLTGCCGVPEGTPPEGEIVSAAETRRLSMRGIENMLVTSLTGYLLSHPGPFTWRLDYEPELRPVVSGALDQLRLIAPVRLDAASPTVFRAKRSGDKLLFLLICGETILWQESAELQK